MAERGFLISEPSSTDVDLVDYLKAEIGVAEAHGYRPFLFFHAHLPIQRSFVGLLRSNSLVALWGCSS